MLSYVVISTLPLATSVLAHACRRARLVALLIALASIAVALLAIGGTLPEVYAPEIQLSFDPLSRLAYTAFVVMVALASLYGWLAREDELLPVIGLAMTGFLGAAFSLSKDLLASGLVFEFAALLGAIGVGLRAKSQAGEVKCDQGLTMRYISYVVVAGTCLVGAFSLATRFEMTREPAVHQVAFALLSFSVLILVGAFPVSFWLPSTLQRGNLMMVALVVSMLGVGGIWLLAKSYQGFPWLMSDQRSIQVLAAIAAGGTVATSLMAISQRRLDHLIACSVSSNAGVALVGVASGSTLGMAGGFFILLNYLWATYLMLMCLEMAGRKGDDPVTPGLRVRAARATGSSPPGDVVSPTLLSQENQGSQASEGSSHVQPVSYTFRRTPATVLALTVGGLVFAGAPPTGGFVGRWMVYEASASQSGHLAFILIASSALVFLAYARLLGSVLLRPASVGEEKSDSFGSALVVVLLSALLLATGLYPAPILGAISEATAGIPRL